MARAGVKTFFAGIESPNKRILKTYKKGGNISADTSRQSVNLLRQYDIETFGGFMIGEPSETKEEVEATIDYACSLNPATAQFTIMTPYPGTEIWQDLKDQLIVHDWDKFDGLHAVFNGIHLSAAEMESLCQKAYMKFYLRSKRIINQISSAIGLKESTGPKLKTMISLLKENIH
jgi:anaerobic magnesium-protoporphyrin IX monomethyl ester cyclase